VDAFAASSLSIEDAGASQKAPPQPPLTRSEEAREPLERGVLGAGDIDAWRLGFAGLAKGEPAAWTADGRPESTGSVKDSGRSWSRLPRVALYQPWTASMDEGWLRWTFEYCGLPFQTVNNARLRGGALAQSFDVLVLPDLSEAGLEQGRAINTVPAAFVGGLEREGRLAIDAFVRGGGRLIAVGRSAQWAIELFQLPLEDTARGKEAGDFSCPGSVLRARLEHVAGDSLSPAEARFEHVFFSGSHAWKATDAKSVDAPQTLASYAASDLLHSGWIRNPSAIAGKAAWVRADVDRGRVHLFAFSPYYRSWSQGTFHWLLRAVMDERTP
jgi:hypothetical protein